LGEDALPQTGNYKPVSISFSRRVIMHAEVVDLMFPWYVWIIMMIGTFIFTVVGTFLVARRIDK
jgi:ABC-type antimicrobial peptide transport system permease subunit